ncbi:MBL fold metallo-hydrolase [Pyxidicoccus caerfyrddinensis]|uniref:MBL fold metallo-hydrolase n=1 Tax=Pyxidicoccus caerfyrddinensis TaxID=2709663 RepID=UPI0013DA885C|nr:MBL fold metallo-hydrolase [Pyxidicoccus caerfyrddinensis]
MRLKTQSLAPDVLVVIGETYASNATLFLDGRDVLMVDALGSRADALALRRFIHEELNARVRLAVCTHGFSDHLAALQEFPEALVLAHERFEETFQAERFRTEEESRFFRPPEMRAAGPLHLRWGRHALEVFPNAGHTASTLNIDVPGLDLLFSADTAVGHMAYIAYGAPEAIDAALGRSEARGRSRVIQGHGGVVSPRTLGSARHYLRALEEAVRGARGVPERVRAIPLSACLPAEVRGSEFEGFFHSRNLDEVVARRLWA